MIDWYGEKMRILDRKQTDRISGDRNVFEICLLCISAKCVCSLKFPFCISKVHRVANI